MNRSYSKIRHIQESNERLEKRMLSEQNTDNRKVYLSYLSKGYVDVTDGFPETYALQIADGPYECNGSGFSFRIVTNDNKDTGYVVVISSGIRGIITGPITVSDNGASIDLGEWGNDYQSLLYNEKLNQVKK